MADGCGPTSGGAACSGREERTGAARREPPRPRSPRRWSAGAFLALAAVLLCAVAGAASAALHASDVRRGPLPALAEHYAAGVTAELVVSGDPRLTRPKVRGSQRTPPVLVFTADAVRVTEPDGVVTAVRTPVLVIVQQRGGGGEERGPKGSGPEGRGSKARGTEARENLSRAWRALLPSTRIRVVARAAPPLSSADQIAAVLRVTADAPPAEVGAPSPSSGWRDTCVPGCGRPPTGCVPMPVRCCPDSWWGTPHACRRISTTPFGPPI